jgi:hypothetical protein
MNAPRLLKASEMDVRVATIKETGCSLLIYKDARVDMEILDEWAGCMDWKREHTRDNKNCIVSIYDKEKKEWVSKEDTGTESMTEKEKGQASDSFKRACFNWGIGRELYTAPFIWVNLNKDEVKKNPTTGKFSTYTKFSVADVRYENKTISYLRIVDDKGKTRYESGKVIKEQAPDYAKMIEDCKNQAELKAVWEKLPAKEKEILLTLKDKKKGQFV